MIAYRFLRWLLRAAIACFFRQVEVVGLEHVPADGPVLFAGNHPNSLIDPILIITTCGRVVHFAAKDTLFRTRAMRAILRGLGAVPLARKDDHGGKVDNEAAFASMFEVLGRGGTIGIFPEGLSHDASQLARLKPGAARLAQGSAARGVPVKIVPCGLTFIHPRRFRSRVLVQYGPPISVEATGDAATLTAEIERALRGLTVNARDWDTVRVLDAVRRLYQPLDIAIDDRVELARRFNTHYPEHADDPRVVDLLARVRTYQGRLDELGLSDRELARDLSPGDAALRVARYLALVLFWLPLMLPGAPLHLPAVALARVAGSRLTPRKDVIATTKVLFGIVFVGIAYLVVGAIVWWKWGWLPALIGAIVLPLSGIATLKVLDGVHLLRRGFGVLGRSLRVRREAESLRGERAQLERDTVILVDALRPAELEPLFPRDCEA